jgi:hypothetical protein
LIGDRDDFGWHLPDLMKSAAGFQVRKRKTSLMKPPQDLVTRQ